MAFSEDSEAAASLSELRDQGVQHTEREVSNKARWEELYVERVHPLTANTPVLKIYTHIKARCTERTMTIPTPHYVNHRI